jgi:hypothetical protein
MFTISLAEPSFILAADCYNNDWLQVIEMNSEVDV